MAAAEDGGGPWLAGQAGVATSEPLGMASVAQDVPIEGRFSQSGTASAADERLGRLTRLRGRSESHRTAGVYLDKQPAIRLKCEIRFQAQPFQTQPRRLSGQGIPP
jgi:hypothetical protein